MLYDDEAKKGGVMAQSKGRGWHGDSKGHARAGRMGGRARRKTNTSQTE